MFSQEQSNSSRRSQSRVLQQVQNKQSAICSGFDNDSIAPIRRNIPTNNPEQRQKPSPSTFRTDQHTPVATRKPEKRKLESPARSPQKRRPWDPDEDRLLMKGFVEYKNDKYIWTLIKNKYFGNSTRTNINLKDRARTLCLK